MHITDVEGEMSIRNKKSKALNDNKNQRDNGED